MKLVFGSDALVAAWVARQIPHVADIGFPPCAAIGVIGEDQTPIAGVVFTNHQPQYGSIDISCASVSARWLTRGLIRGIMAYPFDQLKVQRVTAITPHSATSSRRFLEHFGFKPEGLVRRGFGVDDAVVYGLLAEEWLLTKWMRPGPEVGDEDAKPKFKVERRRRRRRAIVPPPPQRLVH